MSSPTHHDIVVIGTGLAGYSLAREIRKLSDDVSVALISRDDGVYYSKPMLSNGLAKNKSADNLASKTAAEMAKTLDATIANHTTASHIDSETKVVSTDKGLYKYDKLVLAVGAQQIQLPIEGDGSGDVITVNDLGDYARFRARLDGVDRVAVMGPGLIGCEFANDLANVGKVTIIIGPDTRPLERLMPPAASAALKSAMTSLNVEWHLETVVQQIHRKGSGYVLSLASGAEVEAGLVLSAAGLKPDLTLAVDTGLQTKDGIVVDRHMCTSDASIYALGDCVEIEGMVLPYVMPIMHAAKALAKTLNGDATRIVFPAMPVAIKTPVHPIVVAPPPDNITGKWQIEDTAEGVRALFQSTDGVMRGFVLTGSHVREKTKLERELPKLLE